MPPMSTGSGQPKSASTSATVLFASTRVHEVGDGLMHIGGHLDAAGKSVWLELPAILRNSGDELQIEATATVDPQELGMSNGPLGMIVGGAARHGEPDRHDRQRAVTDLAEGSAPGVRALLLVLFIASPE